MRKETRLTREVLFWFNFVLFMLGFSERIDRDVSLPRFFLICTNALLIVCFDLRRRNMFRDDTHMTSMKNVQFLRAPTLLVHLRSKLFHPLNLGRSISNDPPPLQVILCMWTNEIKPKTKSSTSHSNWPCALFFDIAPQTMQYLTV